jgi:hypothetical protein
MNPKLLLPLIVALSACWSATSAPGHIEALGKFYYQPDSGYHQKRCERVSALLASRLSTHYTCSKLNLSRSFGKSCLSAKGPEFVLFDTMAANSGCAVTEDSEQDLVCAETSGSQAFAGAFGPDGQLYAGPASARFRPPE